jgi:peptide deformylase
MAKLKIIKEGSQDLRKKSRPVEKINKRILTLLDDMYETLQEAEGVGLAAPQVGVLRRVAIIEIEDGDLIEMINPEIIVREGEQREVEGCLSSPGKYAETVRPAAVKVAYQNRSGERCEREGTELMARAFCHEIDHLDGVLCFDNAVRLLTKEEVDEMNKEKEEKEEN